ncbi:AEC family transporter [Psychroflexus salinarum]|uniref:AEC family transporter n=1 Tax=Psychroflexus salinarum TaxID=546024 RepID=A0ABW3GQN6_9FLAO
MSNFILIVLCLIVGVLLSKLKTFPPRAHEGINAFIFYVSLPALSLRYIPNIDYRYEILFPALMPWIVFGLAAVLFLVLGKIFDWHKHLIGCLILCCGLGNTSFVGFPLLKLFYGDEAIKYGILADQPGSFMVMATLGIFAAVYFQEGRGNFKPIAKKIIHFPPFIAFIVSLLLTFVEVPNTLNQVFETLGSTLSPLALFSIGTQLTWKTKNFEFWPFGAGLLYKLFLAPLIIFLVYNQLSNSSDLIIKVSIVEAAMAPMITGVLLAIEYKLRPNLASMFAAIGIPLSLLTTYLWFSFLG